MGLRAKLLGLPMVQNTLRAGSPVGSAPGSPSAEDPASVPVSPTSSGASSPMTPGGSIKKSKKAIKKKSTVV
jgi:hypothetical protein